MILAITGFFFILTEALLSSSCIAIRRRILPILACPQFGSRYSQPLTNVFNTSYKIEMAWTVVPAVILVYIAFAQIDTWAEVKYKSRLNKALGDSADHAGAGRAQRPPVRMALSLSQPGRPGLRVENTTPKNVDELGPAIPTSTTFTSRMSCTVSKIIMS